MKEDLKSVVKTLEELTPQARRLDIKNEEWLHLMHVTGDYCRRYVNEIDTSRSYRSDSEIDTSHFLPQEEGSALEDILKIFKTHVSDPGIECASAGHLGYIPAGGLLTGAIGDLLAAVSNKYAGIHFANPGAVQLENKLLEWLCTMIGYPPGSLGNLSSGGSLANLMAVCTARDKYGLKAQDFQRCVFYLGPQTHHCVHKAIRIAGMSEAKIHVPKLDAQYKIDTDHLRQLIQADQQNGLRSFMIVGSAGTTDTGAIDPMEELAAISEEYGTWFHVDAAYGGCFMLVDELKDDFKGIEKSDSCVIDPHKGLFLPYGLGALLIKDVQALHKSHYYTAHYMQDAVNQDHWSPAELSPELTKHFRGLRMWLSLKYFGVKPLRSALKEKRYLCLYFYEKVQQLGFTVGPYPELSVCIYRYPYGKRSNEFNRLLVKNIHQDGDVFLSSTNIDGEVWLRLAVLSFRSHVEIIDRALAMLRRGVEKTKQQIS